ncbi:MAG: hypothetical protein QOD99_1181 [Chthoniobacter sp.]|nr:hypothetical protein [Chthoniobacter sp.]
MATLHTIITAERGLAATRKEYRALKAALESADEDVEAMGHGFELEYWANETPPQVYLYAEEDGIPAELPDAFVDLFVALIRKNGLEYLQFGIANTASRLAPGTHSGSYFRICADGTFWYPRLVWDTPEEPEV